jgi:hypothetical protein
LAAKPASTASAVHSSGASMQTAHNIDKASRVHVSETLINNFTTFGIVLAQTFKANLPSGILERTSRI